jgi:hypothetical protein
MRAVKSCTKNGSAPQAQLVGGTSGRDASHFGCFSSDTVILELKEGPYEPSTDKEFLDAFPSEGTPAARHLVETWQELFNVLDK